jgi:hypothetical protein
MPSNPTNTLNLRNKLCQFLAADSTDIPTNYPVSHTLAHDLTEYVYVQYAKIKMFSVKDNTTIPTEAYLSLTAMW